MTAGQLAGKRVLIPQEAHVFAGTVRENLAYVAADANDQALEVAGRAYLSSAQVVILDEATCHLDPVAEARVEHAFADRAGSLIVIAHRMSSALRARRILVLDGSDVMLGKHDDLLRHSALYRDLVGHWTVPVAPVRG